jgi:DNA-binding winged helix-turn-helix (wHTH) protein
MVIAGKTVSFDDTVIDFKNKKITWKQEEQCLEGDRSWALLEMLINKSPMLLSYSEICRILWPEEEKPWIDNSRKVSIRVNISWIRKAIHDNDEKYIVNTSRKGYTFVRRYTVNDSDLSPIQSTDLTNSNEKRHLKWTDGTIKVVNIYRHLSNSDQSRQYNLFTCDGKHYCAKTYLDSDKKEKWIFSKIKEWIDLDFDRRKSELNTQIYVLLDSDMTYYDFVSDQKSFIDKIFADHPQYSVYFLEQNDEAPDEKKLDMCLAIATLVANCLLAIEPVLSMLPYHYAISVLEWRKKLLSSNIVQIAADTNPSLWSFIYE